MSVFGRVVVTGANGFVGRHVAAALVRAAVPLTLAIRNRASGLAGWSGEGSVSVVEVGDLANADLARLVQGASAIVHCAGDPRTSAASEPDLAITQRLTEAARHAHVRQFVYLSSIMAVTGNTSETVVTDSTTPEPAGRYGALKLAAEHSVSSLNEQGIFAVSLRPPLVVGWDAAGNWRRLQGLAASGLPLPLGGLKALRSYIPVDLLASAIAVIVTTDWPSHVGGAYAIASNERLSMADIILELRSGMGLQPRSFGIPDAAFGFLGTLTGRKHEIGSLTGPLEVDASRFASTFGVDLSGSLREAVRASGAEYRSRAA